MEFDSKEEDLDNETDIVIPTANNPTAPNSIIPDTISSLSHLLRHKEITASSATSTLVSSCNVNTDIQKANKECCIYCDLFGFDDEDRHHRESERRYKESIQQEEDLASWANPVDLASPIEPDAIAAQVGYGSSTSNTLMHHEWLQHEAYAKPDDDDCCVICPYSPTALHVYAEINTHTSQTSKGGKLVQVAKERFDPRFRKCCPACPTQFIIFLRNLTFPPPPNLDTLESLPSS